MRQVDSAVDDRDASAATGHAEAEQPVRADLGGSDLSRGTHEAVEPDVDDVRPPRERGDLGRRRPARDDGDVREPARDRKARALRSAVRSETTTGIRASPARTRSAISFDSDRRSREIGREGESGGDRGSRSVLTFMGRTPIRANAVSKGRAGSDASR